MSLKQVIKGEPVLEGEIKFLDISKYLYSDD